MLLIRFSERRVILTAVVFCTSCVAYFYLLDHFLFSSAGFSPIFIFLLSTFDRETGWLSLAVCLIAVVWNRPAPVLRLVNFFGNHPVSIALGCSVVLGFGNILLYHNYPLSMDEYAAVFQSKIFASGSVIDHVPPGLLDWLVVRGFNGTFLMTSSKTGGVVATYWPGFALLLSPFQYLNVPWLCNASLSGLAIILIYYITHQLTKDPLAAGWAMLFALASSAFVAEGIAYYSMQAHLAANLLFVALLIKPSGRRALSAGLVGSLALILHNPLPHMLFAAPWILAIAAAPTQRRYLLPILAGYVPGIAICIVWLMFRSEFRLGNHGITAVSRVVSEAFRWPDSILINMRIAALVKMSVWAAPCLFACALWGATRSRVYACVSRLAWSAILTFLGYLFVGFDQGHGWGYRYIHSAWGVVPILAACAIANELRASPRVTSFAGAAAILSLLIIVPFQMWQIEQFVSQHLAQLPSPKRPGNNVYFIHPTGGFYVADMVQFDPLLRDRDLLLISHGGELDEKLVRENWPNAVKLSSGQAADQWYLGYNDERVPIPDSSGRRQFVIAKIPH